MWVGAEEVVMVPAVMVTFPSPSITPDAITKHLSIESAASVYEPSNHLRGVEFVLNAITEFRTNFNLLS